MKGKVWALLGLMVLAALIAPETRATEVEWGYASAYAAGVMDEVVRYRFEHDIWRVAPPYDWYTAHGAIAAMDCGRVGEMTTIVDPDGGEYRVLVADCAGADGPVDRFSRDNIIMELDWGLWMRLTEKHGRPLEVGLR